MDGCQRLGAMSLADRRAYFVENGCHAATETGRIFDKWFTASRPRDKLLEYVDRRFEIRRQVVADIGCGYGMALVGCADGSYGIDIEEYQADFARSVGLRVFARNFVEGDISDLPKVEAVWCAAVLEHVDSPHILLRKMQGLLKPGGRIFLEVPCALSGLWKRHLPVAKRIFGDHDDHVNSFTTTTLARFCERAGFQEEKIFRYSVPLIHRLSGFPVGWTRVPPFLALANHVVYVGRKIPEWRYLPRSTRVAADNERGYVWKSLYDSSRQT